MTLHPDFAEHVRRPLYFGTLPKWQGDPLDLIIRTGIERGQSQDRIAYALATAHHECHRFKGMEEYGRGRGRDYGKPVTLIRGRKVTYHGRGFVHLTWLQNYLKMERKLGVPLVDQPDLALDLKIAAKILWSGMIDGDFTGRNFADCTDANGNLDYVKARTIINGTDKDDLIAGYARTFYAALDKTGVFTNGGG